MGERQSLGRLTEIRWLRVLLIGLAAEFALSFVALPFAFLPNGQAMLNIVIVPAALIVFTLFGYWVARPLQDRFVLHGILMGAVGVVLYIVLIFGASFLPGAPPLDLSVSFSAAYLLTHTLKLVGGGLGGWLAARKSGRA
jgi:small-conductance mechanosensitive channel